MIPKQICLGIFLGIFMQSIEVAAAIIQGRSEHAGKIFCAQRGYGEFKDYWEFPGGKLEAGESAENALVRELQEELSASIEIKSLYETLEFDYPKRHVILHFFLCSLKAESMELLEHENALWVKYEDLMQLNWLPADLKLIKKLQHDFCR